jgi:hypothetical protein
MGPDRSEYIFNEENAVIRDHIERLMAGEKSIINPLNSPSFQDEYLLVSA